MQRLARRRQTRTGKPFEESEKNRHPFNKSVMAKRPEILIMNGELASKRFKVPPGGLRLGRSSSNDVHIADEELSRNHCLFEEDGESGIRVLDLASANGTFVNGVQLGGEPKMLALGDEIEAGKTMLRVVDEDTPDVVAVEKNVLAKGRAQGSRSRAGKYIPQARCRFQYVAGPA